MLARSLIRNSQQFHVATRGLFTTSKCLNELLPIKVEAKKTPKGTDVLNVVWSNQKTQEYPAVWLRDNCQCSKCYQASALARLSIMKNLDTEIELTEPKVEDQQIVIKWKDGHESKFKPEFFSKYGPNGTSGDYVGYFQKPETKKWDRNFVIPMHNMAEIEENDEALFSWLNDLYFYGLTVVNNVPKDLDGLPKLVKTIFQPEMTHYAPYFKVESKFNANNVAYTGATIGLHMDLPYYEKTPSVQFLHCIEQFKGEGGENQFSDGLSVADHIRKNYPEEWRLLTSVKCCFSDLGYDDTADTTFYKVYYSPTLKLNEQGSLDRVYYNNQSRSRIMTSGPDETKAYYKALKLWDDLLYSKDFIIQTKLDDGQCVVFDNTRVLHGRNGYTVTEKSSRLYQGGYVAWDEIRSRMNVIKYMKAEMSKHY